MEMRGRSVLLVGASLLAWVGCRSAGVRSEDASGDGLADDVRVDARSNADGRVTDAPTSCSFGEVASEATADDLSLFGAPVYFNAGMPLPAGTYVISYVDGCMKYSADQGWTVNAYADGSDGWWLIGASTADKKLVLPGNIGFLIGEGGFPVFEDCVAASKAAQPETFEHAGGQLGIWLQDSPYTDNLAGEGGRNPKWSLVRMGECPPPVM
jgi:hypothetical protein